MAEKNMNEELQINASVIGQIRNRHASYLSKALASGIIDKNQYEARMRDYDPEETGLESFDVDRDLVNAPQTTKFASYADQENQRLKATSPESLPEGEAALNEIMGSAPMSRRSDIDGGLDILNPRHVEKSKFETRDIPMETRHINSSSTRELIRIATAVSEFERDNSDILPDGWRRDASLVVEVSKIVGTSEGFDPSLVKSVIRDMEN